MDDRKTAQTGTQTSCEDRFEELARRRAWSLEMGGQEAIERHHDRGRLTIRERIDQLSDKGSFQEIGRLTGKAEYDEQGRVTHVQPAPYVMGVAEIDGRPVAVGGEDYTVRGGTSWSGLRRKGGQGGFIEDAAHEYRIPLVNLIDGSGGAVTSLESRGYTVFPGVDGFDRSVELMGEVPVVSAVMGTAAGGPAGRAILSHFSVMVRESSQIFAAGPPVVERALGEKLDREELGGSGIAVDTAGTIDNVADSEEDCFRQIRRFLGYMPSNVWELPPVWPTDDPVDRCEDALTSIIPEQRTRPYNMRRLLELVFDDGSLFEIQPTFGKTVITMLGRMNGQSVGIVANNPMVYGGAMDARGARKQTHFVELCDNFHIPLVFVVDIPGFLVGSGAEKAGTLRDGMRAVYAGLKADVPILTLVVRKCFGMAGMGTINKKSLEFKVAWPSGEWGSLPVEGGVKAAYRREIAAADDPAAKEAEIEERLRRLSSPFRSAEAFAVEEIIDPRETRPYIARFIDLARNRLKTCCGQKLKSGVRP
ncbi:propionyl-CoA carboxylase [Ferruginivarius sediminum]|uniref:Propionyl-CoA carboxylase n=2 Tax=Ferruginivarius sediminum TaxID=2661937 RepID=A0A369T9K8_9PROT|nr:propionyl-CoA carboxylase [Ferruginivarius sediminum]